MCSCVSCSPPLPCHAHPYQFASANGVARLVRSLGCQSTDAALADLEAFFAATPVKGAERNLRQLLEKVRLNNAWMRRELDGLLEHFRGLQQ